MKLVATNSVSFEPIQLIFMSNTENFQRKNEILECKIGPGKFFPKINFLAKLRYQTENKNEFLIDLYKIVARIFFRGYLKVIKHYNAISVFFFFLSRLKEKQIFKISSLNYLLILGPHQQWVQSHTLVSLCSYQALIKS